MPSLSTSRLLLDHTTSDDAALYRLSANSILVTTTDFFMPIVDDPFDFGCIAAANALSDIYAMGGKPILALNILGMPMAKVAVETIDRILTGGRTICERVDVAIAGGHSIDCQEPFYGLSVCGTAHPNHIKRNSTAQANDVLLLGKPLGIGVLATAYKQGKLDQSGYKTLINYASQLNSVGGELARLKAVHAITDVTGFGLLGHLLEICKASKLQAVLNVDDIPLLSQAVDLATNGITAGAALRNWENCRNDTSLSDKAKTIKALLTDPQTNGGLLVACAPKAAPQVQDLFVRNGFEQATAIGLLNNLGSKKITVV